MLFSMRSHQSFENAREKTQTISNNIKNDGTDVGQFGCDSKRFGVVFGMISGHFENSEI